jgi:O-methyltransferase involved in polyketide biosynthesis
MTEIVDENYTSIIPTAYVTAYPRIFTDIPNSKEIFNELKNLREISGKPPIDDEQKVSRLAPELEARHKLIDKLILDTKITQVLELAAGLSPRGLTFTANPSNIYAELDLDEMAKMKQQILRKIAKLPQNLKIISGNALKMDDLDRSVLSFDKQTPIAVINEGLLRYLNFDEKAIVARNVHALLERFGGVWITSDTTPRKFLATQDKVTKKDFNKKLSSLSQKNFENNMFEDNEHAVKFFSDLGFSIEVHPFIEIIDELSSPKELGYSRSETMGLLGEAVVVVMRLKA